jgi:hypothetical protein
VVLFAAVVEKLNGLAVNVPDARLWHFAVSELVREEWSHSHYDLDLDTLPFVAGRFATHDVKSKFEYLARKASRPIWQTASSEL